MELDVTKLSVDQFNKYFDFVMSVYSSNDTELQDGFEKIARDAIVEKRKRDRESSEIRKKIGLDKLSSEELVKYLTIIDSL